MERQLSTIYQKIFNQLDEMIPEKWIDIIFYAECSSEHSKITFYYKPTKSEELIYYTDIRDIFKIDDHVFKFHWRELIGFIEQLHQTFIDHGQEPWTNLTMRFDSNGKFSIDYHYDDFTDISPIRTLLMWEYQHLGMIPDKTSSYYGFLEEYIEKLISENKTFNGQPVKRINE
jgi:uncharacterized protein (TIGR01741 family)